MSAIRLTTEVPGPRSRELLARREAAVPRGPYNATPIFIEEGHGAILTDVDGNRLLDFAGGLGCLNVGHANEAVVKAASAQLERSTHSCFHVTPYESYVRLAERLNALVPGDFPKKTLLANSGAEAVENAVKIARVATGRPAVLAFEDGFHGRTLLAMSLTSKVHPYKAGFGPFAPETYRAPYAYCYRCAYHLSYPSCGVACVDALEDYFNRYVEAEKVAAIIVEPVLGEGGFVVPPTDYLPKLRELTARHGILLIADEVQTGFGRTGRMWAAEHSGVVPDIVIAAKSSALDQMEKEKLFERAEHIGRTVAERFAGWKKRLPLVGDVRGLGAMWGIELVKDRDRRTPAKEETAAVAKRCYEEGLVTINAGTYGNVVRTLMPLVINDDELAEGLGVLERALEPASREEPS
jgi:4-aminobutyrate aminotransferase/(S)-3-amino-2-methylpropionate transaminase